MDRGDAPQSQYVQICGLTVPKPIPKSAPVRRKRSDSSSISSGISTPTRDSKSSQYKDVRHKLLLEAKGSFMNDAEVTLASKAVYQQLLDARQQATQSALFGMHCFETTCSRLQDRGDARVIPDTGPLFIL